MGTAVSLGPRTAYVQVAGMQAGVTTTGGQVISDNGSLLLSRNGQTAIAISVVLNAGIRNFTSGLLYGFIRMIDNTSVSTSLQGFAFLQSAADISTDGSFYAAVLRVSSGPSNIAARLYKHSAGLDAAGTQLADSGTIGVASNGTIMGLAVRFAYHAIYGPGVRVRMYAKADASDLILPDYSDSATPTLEYIDSSSPLSVSLGEGEILQLGSSTLDRQVSYDRVGRFAQAVGAVS